MSTSNTTNRGEGGTHLSHRLADCWGVFAGQAKLLGVAFAGNRRNDAISDSVWKNVRPLLHGLVGDADFLGGCGDGSTKKFNGFGLKHAVV